MPDFGFSRMEAPEWLNVCIDTLHTPSSSPMWPVVDSLSLFSIARFCVHVILCRAVSILCHCFPSRGLTHLSYYGLFIPFTFPPSFTVCLNVVPFLPVASNVCQPTLLSNFYSSMCFPSPVSVAAHSHAFVLLNFDFLSGPTVQSPVLLISFRMNTTLGLHTHNWKHFIILPVFYFSLKELVKKGIFKPTDPMPWTESVFYCLSLFVRNKLFVLVEETVIPQGGSKLNIQRHISDWMSLSVSVSPQAEEWLI